MRCSLLDTGFSDYNLGLRLHMGLVESINQSILKAKNDISYIFLTANSHKVSINSFVQSTFEGSVLQTEGDSYYYPIKLSVGHKVLIHGVIRQDSYLVPLYFFGESILQNVPLRYLTLIYNKQVLNYDYFAFKTVKDVINLMKQYLKENQGIEKEVKKIGKFFDNNSLEFELSINFEEYGSLMCDNIFKKLEGSTAKKFIRNLDESSASCFVDEIHHPHFLVASDFSKEVCLQKLRSVLCMLFENINFLNKFAVIFGTLYESIKHKILAKYNLN
jgi:hypothetical protein